MIESHKFLKKLTDPVDKEQTKVYFSNYRDPLQKFEGPFMASIARSYWEVID